MLAESLTTQGVALARLGNQGRARTCLQQAIEVAETVGDLEGAGRTKLSIIEELGEKISGRELIAIYRSAIELLKDSQDPETGKRLIKCADALLETLSRLELQEDKPEELTWEGFSFKEHIKKSERAVIERALRDTDGSVTKAARLLGFKHHQSLISLINTRHKDLIKSRTTVRKRRRPIFSQPSKIRYGEEPEDRDKSELTILHVEDNEAIVKLVHELLTADKMNVESCATGTAAFEILKGRRRCDLLIVDNELPGISGLELIVRVRSLTHRRNIRIIMLSGDDIEKEAWRAGADDFIPKANAIRELVPRIERVLQKRKREKLNKTNR